MKKRILAVLLSALILANISACDVAPENEIESTVEGTEDTQNAIWGNEENDQSQVITLTTSELVETLRLSNTFSMVLKNKTKVCNSTDDSLAFLDDYIIGSVAYAYVSTLDLDENGVNDVVVLECGDKVIILKEHEGVVYAWQYRHTALYNLLVDGTYFWSEQAGQIYGFSKLQFDGIRRNDVDLGRVEYNEKFYINKIEVSQEEYLSYVQSPKLAEKADRYWWETGFKISDNQINGK